jgi:hypothetical protein
MCFPSLRIPAAGFVASLSKLMPRAYSIASVEPKFTLVGGQNIPVTDLVLEVVEFETGPFLAEETEPKMRKGVASNFLTRLPIGELIFLECELRRIFRLHADTPTNSIFGPRHNARVRFGQNSIANAHILCKLKFNFFFSYFNFLVLIFGNLQNLMFR